MRIQISFLLLALLFCANHAQAQVVTGRVTYSNAGLPAEEAVVKVKRSRISTFADREGYYRIELDSIDQVLSFCMIGCFCQEFKIGGDTVLDVTLKRVPTEMPGLEITAYAHYKDKNGAQLMTIDRIDKEWAVNKDIEWVRHLYENINYPDSAIVDEWECQLYSHFAIDSAGNLSNPLIYRSPHPLFSREVLAALAAMPPWDVGNDKKYFPHEFVLRVRFSINK
jgi:hypothetical protein